MPRAPKDSRLTVGLLTIGQSPRPDLTAPLQAMVSSVDWQEAGALDGLTAADLPAAPTGVHPLTTRMADGALIKVDTEFLLPRMQAALDRLVDAGVDLALILCAGSFHNLHSSRPLLRPFDLICAILEGAGIVRLLVLCPFAEQAEPIALRWRQAGFVPWVVTTRLAPGTQEFEMVVNDNIVQNGQIDALVLDYVGHPIGTVRRLQRVISAPVFDLGLITFEVLATLAKGRTLPT